MKQKLLLFATALLSTMSFAQSQKVAFKDWETNAGIQAMFQKNITKVDGSGNVYTAGATLNTNGKYDIFLTKVSSGGTLLYSQQINGAANDQDFALGLSFNGTDVYMTGTIINNTVTLVPELFITKYNSSGTQQFFTTYSGGYGDAGKEIVTDASGNSFVTGGTYNTSGNSDMLLIKYNNSGVQQWVSTYDYTSHLDDAGAKVTISGSNVTIVGPVTTSAGNYLVSTRKYSQSTGALTINGLGITTTSYSTTAVTDLVMDASGNYYIVGSTSVSGQGENMYVQKINSSLLSAWTYTYNAAANLDDIARAVQVDGSGNVYISGVTTHTSQGKNLTVIKLNSSGVNQWTKNINNTTVNDNDGGADLALDASNDIYVTGYQTVSTNNTDIYSVKLENATGNIVWEVLEPSALNDVGTNIIMDNNVVIVAGSRETTPGNFEYVTYKYVQKEIQIPIEATAENPNISYMFYQNKGQILNSTSTGVESDVTFSTMETYPTIFFKPKTLSYKLHNFDTLSAVADTIQRIDISLNGGSEAAKQYPLEKAHGVINFFDATLPANVIDVQGYKRLVASEVYTGIDAHYYSNSNGFKIYYVVKPGAKPSDIVWSISGANSTTITGTNLVIKGINTSIIYDQPNFYQTNVGGTTTSTLATGTWTTVGTNQYKFNVPTYNNTLPLIIELDYGNTANSSSSAIANLEFCTFYGGALDDGFRSMKVNSTDGSYVVLGNTKSWDIGHEFPAPGSNTSSNNGMGYEYMTLVMFDSIGVRQCANIYGNGANDFYPMELVINESTKAVTVVGNTWATTLPAPNAATGGTYSKSTGRGFVVQFQQSGTSQSLNQIKWSSRLNGYAAGIGIKPTTKEIYITSSTNNPTYAADLMTKANAYNKSTSYSKWHYQISKFDNLGNRLWATYFPAFNASSANTGAQNSWHNSSNSTGFESYLKCRIDCDDYGFTIAGEVKDTGLVIFNKYHQAIDSTYNGNYDAFVSRFNSNDSIVFSQYIGGTLDDGYNDLKYANPNQIILTGYSKSTQYKNLTYRANSSQYIDTIMPANATKMLITKIDSTGQKIWSTFYGSGNGTNESCVGWSLTNDVFTNADGTTSRLIVTGVATNSDFRIATTNPGGVMNNTSNLNVGTGAGSADAFMLAFNANNTVAWNTYFGGTVDECGMGVEYNSKKNRIMLAGFTNTGNAGSSWTNKFPTCYTTFNSAVWYKNALNASTGSTQIYAGYIDGFVGWFNGVNIVGIEEYFKDKTAIADVFNLFPNPTNGNAYIAFKDKLEGQTLIEIYSITGQLLYSNVKNSIFDKTIIELPTSNFSNAMYIVNVKNQNNSISKKLIINK